MAETTRGSNGRFARKSGGETGENGIAAKPDSGSVGAGDDGITVIDPAKIDGANDSEPREGIKKAGRPRGRPKGSGKTKTSEALDLSALNALLYSCHSLLAIACKTPEVALSETESEQLANATANVARHYNFAASQKTMDWGNFIITAGMIYVPRFVIITANAKEKRREKMNGIHNPAPYEARAGQPPFHA